MSKKLPKENKDLDKLTQKAIVRAKKNRIKNNAFSEVDDKYFEISQRNDGGMFGFHKP